MAIQDVEPTVLRLVLEFVYGVEIEPTVMARWAAKVWLAANIFELPLLKKVVTKMLKIGMTDAECLELLLTFVTAGRQTNPEEAELLDAVLRHYHDHSGKFCESVCKTVSNLLCRACM